MNVLNIIDKIYENENFTTILVVAVLVLILLFVIVLILGKKDAKKRLEPPKEVEEDVKDITFNTKPELEKINEDVTFEMPILTKNLENFKKSLEEEIQKEDNTQIRKTSGKVNIKNDKPVKILDMNEIEETTIIPIIKPNNFTELEEELLKNEPQKEELNQIQLVDDDF